MPSRLHKLKLCGSQMFSWQTGVSAILFIALLIGSPHTAHLAKAENDSSAPNIVLILADDLGYGDVQVLNPEQGKISTPHIDQLAAEGMTFTDAHSGSSVCTPTRYGLLTGRYAWRTRLQSGVLSNYEEPLIAADRLTLPALLKQQGYHSACMGKWHLGFTIEKDATSSGKRVFKDGAPVGSITHNGPTARGFDTFFGFHHSRMMKSVFEDGEVTMRMEPVEMLPALAAKATAYISERSKTGSPFFLYLPLNSPHTPIVPSAKWQGKSGLGPYADFVMETDWAVGKVLTALKAAGVSENTLVIFTSDNGCSPAAGINELEAEGHFPSAHMRGYKSDIWDGGHRVPMFVRWPGVVKPKSSTGQLICLTDFMATFAELLNLELPVNAGEDSISFLPVLKGTVSKNLRTTVVHHSINGKFAIRQENWKLELCPGSGGWGKPDDATAKKKGLPAVQLHDLDQDPAEVHNAYQENKEVVVRLAKLLENYIEDGRSTPGPKRSNDIGTDEIKYKPDNFKLRE